MPRAKPKAIPAAPAPAPKAALPADAKAPPIEPVTRAVLLAADAAGRRIVSIHAKLTYRLQLSGACVLADQQAAFLELGEDQGEETALPELDILPHKAATDLIIMASAHAPRGKRAARLTASIECGDVGRRMRVQGDRRCIYKGRGSIAFSAPEPFERVPLRYERAYGGCDPTVTPEQPKTLLEAVSPHPGIYPRNPAGRGYVVNETPWLIDGLLLPNIEDPRGMLTPERLVSGGPENWWRQPLPWSCDWFDASWYPRCVYLGALPDFLPDDDRQVEEVRRGQVPPGQNARIRAAAMSELIDRRFSDAATPGLVLPFMKGDEAVRLHGMMPGGDFVVRLPGAPPRMEVRLGRRSVELTPVPNRVLIGLEEMGVYIVWHGAYATPRPLPDRPQTESEPAAGWDLGGVDAFVDGVRVSPLP